MLVKTIQERMNEWRREVGDTAGAMSLSRDGGGRIQCAGGEVGSREVSRRFTELQPRT